MNDNDKCEAANTVLPIDDADSAPEMPAGYPADVAATRFPAMASAAGPLRKVDGRTRAARAFHKSRRELVQALGGADHVTPQQMIALRIVAEADALRRSLFADATRGIPVLVADYSALAQVSLRALRLIGMERKARDVMTLQQYLAQPPEPLAAPISHVEQGSGEESAP